MTNEVTKKIAIVPFPGGRLEVRNAYTYPERDQNGTPTGVIREARSGTFICLPGINPIEVSGLDLDDLLSATICQKLKNNKLAQQILKENLASQLNA